MAREERKLPLWRRILRSAALALVSLLLMAVFYLAVIMGQPQPHAADEAAAPRQAAELTPLSAPVLITDAAHLTALQDFCPAPMLITARHSTLQLQRGLCTDATWEGNAGRIVTLEYKTADGLDVVLTTICPADALQLLPKEDYAITGKASPTVAGIKSVRMENEGHIRLHAQGDSALYVVTAPHLAQNDLIHLTSALQLSE